MAKRPGGWAFKPSALFLCMEEKNEKENGTA
jgi:hypothetical protein